MRILDLDGSVVAQNELVQQTRPAVVPFRDWGPRLRLGCAMSRFRRFEEVLADQLGSGHDCEPCVTFIGSGDFHHVSLALLHRLTQPFNLLVLDKHPDWMQHIPVMHCGTWLNHAARLPLVRRVFHVGGDLDFDNAFRWLAPWDLLGQGRISVLPAVRRFQRGRWDRLPHTALRAERDVPVHAARVERLLEPYRADLARWPLYVSVDKDVLRPADAVVNWDSGHLHLDEAAMVLRAFCAAAGTLAGLDMVGDWSPVDVQGLFRRVLHWTEHPNLAVDPHHAATCNEQANLALLAAAGVMDTKEEAMDWPDGVEVPVAARAASKNIRSPQRQQGLLSPLLALRAAEGDRSTLTP